MVKGYIRCPKCKGSGGVATTPKNGYTKPCPQCKGKGLIKVNR